MDTIISEANAIFLSRLCITPLHGGATNGLKSKTDPYCICNGCDILPLGRSMYELPVFAAYVGCERVFVRDTVGAGNDDGTSFDPDDK